jgi:5-methyltetrahydrofolate--homocysteine methyltransferase
MSFLAGELERQGMSVPLLIGGATTSRVHTAVKIDPNYRRGPVVHVNDASRAVSVASSLLSPERREAYAAEVRADYAKISAAHFRAQADKKRLKLADARANAVVIDFAKTPPKKPAFLGVKSFRDYNLAELAEYIDWTPFFHTWELTGRFPAILDDAKVGEVARSLYDDARKMLDLIVRENWFKAQATIGFWPANADGDDISVYADDSRNEKIATFRTLRQQLEKREGRFNSALSDFIAPASSGVPDYIGAFVVTAGIGEDVVADRFKNANDDYSSILCKALADRLAEAFAERMHARVRREFWAYAPDETLAPDQLILEQYAGIRPAPGYPAQPDHTEKATLFHLLDAENTAGVKLTESFAMWPGSSVSGLYFSHPESFYFGVGKIERDQVEDYAVRKGWSVAEAERWLAPVLNYIPTRDQSAQDRRVKEAMPTLAPSSAAPANDVAPEDIASHPPGCNCAVHLAYRKKAARAG